MLLNKQKTLLLWAAIVGMIFSCAPVATPKKEEPTALPILGRLQPNGEQHRIAEFEFEDVLGNSITSEDMDGQVYLTEFFYASCPSVCPKVGEQLLKVYEELKYQEGFKILSITLDPGHDDETVLKEHIKMLGLTESKNWFFLRGDKEMTYRLARESFYTPIKEILGVEKEIIHDGILVLVDQEGHIRGMYDGMDASSPSKIKKDVMALLGKTDGLFSEF